MSTVKNNQFVVVVVIVVVIIYSAGIGRTGVFIAIDIGISTIDDTNSVDILKILSTLRQYRGGLIQTPKQYIFVYQVIRGL